MSAERVLVVDDDRLNVELLTALLQKEGCSVTCAYNGRQGWELFQEKPADLVLMDIRMPRLGGMELLKRIKDSAPRTPVIMMTAYATIESAVEAMRLGAYDYLPKPFRQEQIEMLLNRLGERDRLYSQNEYLRSEIEAARGHGRLVTVDRNMLRICEATRRAACSKASVLVQGESGTGKELIARYIHQMSPRKDGPFIRVNCASLAETLLESEMFGHEKGAFTGAVSRRPGRFELANGGTLLLDEIGEISPGLQAKLLRVLEEEEFERVGGTSTLRVDLRVVATTNKNLKQAIDAGAFRKDLYYRLNVVPIWLPPLRERRADIPPLINHFLKHYAEQGGRPAPRISDEALRLMCRYDWPGNVRELKNLIQRLLILNPPAADSIDPDDLPGEMLGVGAAGSQTGISVGHTIQQAERWLILETLRRTSGSRTEAAEFLGVTTRTLRNKLARYRQEAAQDRAERSDLSEEEFSALPKKVPARSDELAEISGGIPFATASMRG